MSSGSGSEPRAEEAGDIGKVVRALRTVPETHLLIVELARDSVTEDGELDYDRLAEMQREVNLAVAQANAYSRATNRVVQALRGLPARRGDWWR